MTFCELMKYFISILLLISIVNANVPQAKVIFDRNKNKTSIKPRLSIPYQEVEHLHRYKDMAIRPFHNDDEANDRIEQLVHKLINSIQSEPLFDDSLQPIRTIHVNPHFYHGLILSIVILGMLSCLFFCLLIKARLFDHQYSSLSHPEKLSTSQL